MLTEKQLREGIRKCTENVQNLLYSVNLLFANHNTQQYAIGLYMYAVEEFGKAVILTDSFNRKVKKKYRVPKWIFGRGDAQNRIRANNQRLDQSAHDKKLRAGFEELPSACREISLGIKITTPLKSPKIFRSTKEPIVKKIKPEDRDITIFVSKGMTGFFSQPTRPRNKIEFDLKTDSFYIDWDKVDNMWKFLIPVEPYGMRRNCELFHESLSKFKLKWCSTFNMIK
jgi:AbiV family abortive infection protein